MIETHPFVKFVPQNAKYLILGSFTGKEIKKDKRYDWFYCTPRNQFWPIMEEVYQKDLSTRASKQELFNALGIAISDVILQCERKKDSNLDLHLTNIVYNTKAVLKIINSGKIRTLYFTSRFSELKFRKYFFSKIRVPNLPDFITLPSPSPRFAKLSKSQKADIYRSLLPSGNISSYEKK